MKYYICNYADYVDLPDKLFCDHTPPMQERKSLDGTKFIARCKDHLPTEGCLSWMNGTEQSFTHDQIILEINNNEWSTEE